jgi:hypothetical protein
VCVCFIVEGVAHVELTGVGGTVFTVVVIRGTEITTLLYIVYVSLLVLWY